MHILSKFSEMKINRLLLIVVYLFVSCNPAPEKGQQLKSEKNYCSTYKGQHLDRIAFPVGGIGAGMICIEGTGAFSHVSVRNTVEVYNEPLMFAAISIKGMENGTKLLEGPVPTWKYFGNPSTANGGERTSYGLPRFRNSDFEARFPFVTIHLTDREMLVAVKIKGWSPFIPGDADNSSLPFGGFEYIFKNTGSKKVEAVFSFNSVNFMQKGDGILTLSTEFI